MNGRQNQAGPPRAGGRGRRARREGFPRPGRDARPAVIRGRGRRARREGFQSRPRPPIPVSPSCSADPRGHRGRRGGAGPPRRRVTASGLARAASRSRRARPGTGSRTPEVTGGPHADAGAGAVKPVRRPRHRRPFGMKTWNIPNGRWRLTASGQLRARPGPPSAGPARGTGPRAGRPAPRSRQARRSPGRPGGRLGNDAAGSGTGP